MWFTIFQNVVGAPLFCKRGHYEDIFVGYVMYESTSDMTTFISMENRREWIKSILEDESKTNWKILIEGNPESIRGNDESGQSPVKIERKIMPLLVLKYFNLLTWLVLNKTNIKPHQLHVKFFISHGLLGLNCDKNLLFCTLGFD